MSLLVPRLVETGLDSAFSALTALLGLALQPLRTHGCSEGEGHNGRPRRGQGKWPSAGTEGCQSGGKAASGQAACAQHQSLRAAPAAAATTTRGQGIIPAVLLRPSFQPLSPPLL